MYEAPWVYQPPQSPMMIRPPPLIRTRPVPGFGQRPSKRVRAKVTLGDVAVPVFAMTAAGIHGYMRNRTFGWTALWALGGFICPVVTISFALSQGFAQKARA